MEQATRNQLQRATQAARTLLEQEFAAQLEGTYDILPDGTIPETGGPHLEAAGRLLRQKLVETNHHRAATDHPPPTTGHRLRAHLPGIQPHIVRSAQNRPGHSRRAHV